MAVIFRRGKFVYGFGKHGSIVIYQRKRRILYTASLSLNACKNPVLLSGRTFPTQISIFIDEQQCGSQLQ
ncbi:MAG: hypothetical protein ACLRSW_03635 [Christensenellaceae bacterium]